MKLDDLRTACAEPTPTPDERDIAEQRPLDSQRIKARHVAGRVDAVKQNRVVGHRCRMMPGREARPTHSVNRSGPVDSWR